LIQNRFSPASGRQGDTGDAVFYILKGETKLTVVSEQGKEAIIAILGAEEFFGEGYLAGQAQRIATVTTMTDTVIARLEKSAINQVAKNHPHASPVLPGNKRREGQMKLRANCVIISEICLARP
jgi:signal-transduction protein with cAMP-binding, CBS, and nucleotidyltransferase domain